MRRRAIMQVFMMLWALIMMTNRLVGRYEVKLEVFGAPVGLFFSIDKLMGKNTGVILA